MTASPLPVPVAAMLASRIGSIPGCRLMAVPARWESVTIPEGRTGCEIVIEGRSPSLHKVEIARRVSYDPTQDDDAMLADILHQLRRVTALQERRARDGIAAGHAFPMPLAHRAMHIGHLHMDASAIALRLEDEIARKDRSAIMREHVFLDLQLALQSIHQNVRQTNGGATIATGSNVVRETPTARLLEVPTQFVRVGQSRQGRHTRMQMTLIGNRLIVPGVRLPDTVIGAVRGRRCCDIAQVHPLIDGRIVESIDQDADGIVVHLAPMLVRIGDFDGGERANRPNSNMVPDHAEALARLRVLLGATP